MPKSVREYHRDKRKTSKHRGLEYDLSISDIHILLFMARITIREVGIRKGMYVLSRIRDEGGYIRGNCRFITAAENNREVPSELRARGTRTGNTKKRTPEQRKRLSEGQTRNWATNPARKDRLRESNRINPRRARK